MSTHFCIWNILKIIPLETKKGFSFYIKYSLKLKTTSLESASQRDCMMSFPASISHILKLIHFPDHLLATWALSQEVHVAHQLLEGLGGLVVPVQKWVKIPLSIILENHWTKRKQYQAGACQRDTRKGRMPAIPYSPHPSFSEKMKNRQGERSKRLSFLRTT